MAVNKLIAKVAPRDDDAPVIVQVPASARPSIASSSTHKVRLWDLPLRLFHWSLLAAVTVAIVSGKLGGEWMSLHGQAGIAIVGLLAFRLVWGVVGSGTSRFAHFLPTPRALLDYLKGRWRGIGHNPLGALSVVALLGLIGAQTFTGLFGNDDIAYTGPLAALTDVDTSLWFTGWHRLGVNALFVLLGLHVLAIVFHVKFKKDDIVTPMVKGWKDVPETQPAPRPARRLALVLALLAGLAGGYAASGAWIAEPAPPAPAAPSSATPGTGSAAPAAPAW